METRGWISTIKAVAKGLAAQQRPKPTPAMIGTPPKLWEKSRLRDRMDAVIAHEHEEARGIPHEEVVELAPDTTLPIGDNAQRILRTIAEGVKRQGGR